MIFLYLGLCLLALFLIGYLLYFRILSAQGWKLATNEPWPPRESGETGSFENRWLFTGPRVNSKQNWHQKMVHHPHLFLRAFYLHTVKGTKFVTLLIKAKIKTGKWKVSHNITEKKIYDIMTNGPFLMIAEMEGDLLKFTCPKLPVSEKTALDPSNLTISLNVKKEGIEHVTWNGEDISDDYGLILSLVLAMLIVWVHPQTHVASELSAREIATKKIEALEPSNRFVLALHDGLLYSEYSPLTENQSLHINIDRQFVINSAVNLKMPHIFAPEKMQFQYYRYLMESRGILIKKLKEHGLEVQPDLLFNNMIVHSIDHYLLYKHLKPCVWSPDGKDENRSYWKSQVFCTVWVSDLESILQKERIRKFSSKKFPFYKDLYNDLVPLDKELSDCILASTSF